MASTPRRVIAHLRRSAKDSPVAAKFTESIVSALSQQNGHSKEDEDEITVKCSLDSGRFIIDSAAPGDPGGALIRRPPQCPIKLMRQEHVDQLTEDVISRGVGVAVVALVESSDAHVLLTRRAKHMRTFPGIWVPPGGGIDEGETLLQAGLRELKEEVGLDIGSEEACQARVLCLWESVYPPLLERGAPKRHHVVVYFHILLKEAHGLLDERIVFQQEEVDASAWLSRDNVNVVVHGKRSDGTEANKTFKMKVLDEESGQVKHVDCPSQVLRAKAPVNGVDVDRVSWGTVYALSQWLKISKKMF